MRDRMHSGPEVMLPISLAQTVRRMSSITGAGMPPAAMKPAIIVARSLMVPSGSPRISRMSACSDFTTPGAMTSLAE